MAMAIPKILHQTSKTADIGEACRPYQEKLIRLHPDWQYHLWTDADNLEFVRKEFPDFLDTFVALPKPIMRADVIRYLLMYKIGGLYMDTDYEMLKPFDLLDYPAVVPCEFPGEPGRKSFCNSLFASAPGNIFFKYLIDDLKAKPPLTGDVDVLHATGPQFVTRIYYARGGTQLPVYTPAPELFSPQTPRNHRERRAIIAKGVAYGIHHCHGTWREWSPLYRLKVAAGRLYRRLPDLIP